MHASILVDKILLDDFLVVYFQVEEAHMFIAREEELRTIRESLGSSRRSTILVYGRRRMGKTSLIREALKGIDDSVIIYHEFHQVTLERNIAEFSLTIGRAFGMELPAFRSLPDAFAFIGSMGKKAVVIMDEYSDMKENARKGEVDSYMRTAIDDLPDHVSLIATGSLVKVMEELLDERNPLFSRFTVLLKLNPLSYYDAARFFPERTHYEQLQLYSVFGGSPYVLSLIDGTSLKRNICSRLISISGSIRAYVEAVVNVEVARIPHGITILTLLGNGKRKYSEIEDVVGRDASGVLAGELRKLVDLDVITRTVPINKSSRSKVFYEISDPVIRFYFAYIYPNPALLMTNPEAFYETFISRSIADFMARRFETACRQYFALLVKNGIRTDILDIGSYWYDDKERRCNGEFDVALRTMEGYEIYDAKFVKSPFTEREAEGERLQISRIPGLSVSRWGIISSAGFRERSNAYIQISLDDMFFEDGAQSFENISQ